MSTTNEREVIKMFYIDCNGYYEEFPTYREAEIFCGEHGIPCSEIFED